MSQLILQFCFLFYRLVFICFFVVFHFFFELKQLGLMELCERHLLDSWAWVERTSIHSRHIAEFAVKGAVKRALAPYFCDVWGLFLSILHDILGCLGLPTLDIRLWAIVQIVIYAFLLPYLLGACRFQIIYIIMQVHGEAEGLAINCVLITTQIRQSDVKIPLGYIPFIIDIMPNHRRPECPDTMCFITISFKVPF